VVTYTNTTQLVCTVYHTIRCDYSTRYKLGSWDMHNMDIKFLPSYIWWCKCWYHDKGVALQSVLYSWSLPSVKVVQFDFLTLKLHLTFDCTLVNFCKFTFYVRVLIVVHNLRAVLVASNFWFDFCFEQGQKSEYRPPPCKMLLTGQLLTLTDCHPFVQRCYEDDENVQHV